MTTDDGGDGVVDRIASASVSLGLRGLRAATRLTSSMLGRVTDDPRTEAVRADIAATFRRLLELPESIAAAAPRPTDAAEVRQRFQDLLAASTDIHTVQGERALLDIVTQLAPDEARMVRHLGQLGVVPAADLLKVSVAGATQDVLIRGMTRLPELAGAAEVGREAVYVRNLRRLDVMEWQPLAVEGTEDYQLFEGRPDVAAHIRRLRADRTARARLRRGRFVLTPLGERLLEIGAGP